MLDAVYFQPHAGTFYGLLILQLYCRCGTDAGGTDQSWENLTLRAGPGWPVLSMTTMAVISAGQRQANHLKSVSASMDAIVIFGGVEISVMVQVGSMGGGEVSDGKRPS